MYQLSEVKTIHLEVCSKCNANCPMCSRSVMGGRVNPLLPLVELSLDDVQRILPKNIVENLQFIFMCGNYGDPIVAKETLEIFKYLRGCNQDIRLELITNGGARTTAWWSEIAKVVDSCCFGIDGLQDTNHVYRRGVRWEKLIENIQAYIQAGGKARWEFIVFRHNEHQIDEARAMSEKMGFAEFSVKKTGRFFNNQKSQSKDRREVLNRNDEVEYYIEIPKNIEYRNKALQKERALINKYGSLEKYFNTAKVSCKVAAEKSLYISSEGLAFPCCWTANQLYPWYDKPKSNQVWDLFKDKDEMNALKHDLESVVSGEVFQKKIPESWEKNSMNEGKLKVCAKTCGVEFDRFKAQFS